MDKIREDVLSIIASVLNTDTALLEGDLGIGDLPNWDSLHHMSIIMELETKFSIKFISEETSMMENIDDIVEIVRKKIS